MVDDGFRYFRSKATGLVGRYPKHFEDYPTLEEIDPNDAECIDCFLTPEDDLTDSVETYGGYEADKTDTKATAEVAPKNDKDGK